MGVAIGVIVLICTTDYAWSKASTNGFEGRQQLRQILRRHVSMLLLGLATAVVCSMLSVEIIKKSVGRPRPNSLQMCEYDKTTHQCTASEHLNHKAFQSFPSGHAGISFSALGYTSLLLYQRMVVCRVPLFLLNLDSAVRHRLPWISVQVKPRVQYNCT